MDSPLHVRLLTTADLPFADAVRALAGWNQTLQDWERLLCLEPDGCFLAEWNGAPVGTALTTVYNAGLAWIGMVLVHPEHRRRGIGRTLVQRCLEYLHARGARCIKLDATPAGRAVYHTLGFRDEWTLRRWVRNSAPPLPHSGRRRPVLRSSTAEGGREETLTSKLRIEHRRSGMNQNLRPWRSTDAPLVEPLDAATFGVSRQPLVRALAQQSRCSLVLESETGRLFGYGLLRPGSRALYLGPVTAVTAEAGLRLVEALLAQSEGQEVFWDIPDANSAAVSWAEQQGFTVQRPLMRMFLGENFAPGKPLQQFALAGPETG